MSYIEALEIWGIRAFSPANGEVIRFSRPLTLIAGINGSGKTTIIECLRYATTGSLPPNAGKSGLWIHDPDLLSQATVHAMTKLKFRAAEDVSLVAARRLTMEVKKTGSRSQKASESSLVMRKNGEKFTLSTRVAELDQILPQYLGVSPSLLDNVIFCHQESSSWPLDESGVLKKKFDEIFEAGKYTAAVKELLTIRKKYRAELATQTVEKNNAKKDRDRARRARQRMSELNDEVEALRSEHKELSERRDHAASEAKQFYDHYVQYNQIVLSLESYRNQASAAEQALAELKSHLTETDESDEWLENALSRFDDTIQGYEEEKANKAEQYHTQDEVLRALKDDLDDCLTQQGQHEQDKQTQQQRLERRKEKVRESAAKHSMRGFSDLDDEAKIGEFLLKIKTMSRDSTKKVNKSRTEADSSKRDAQTRINKLTERQSVLKDNRTNVNKQAATNNREVGIRQAEADKIDVNEGDVAVHKTKIADLNEALNNARTALQNVNYPAKLKTADVDLSSSKADLKELNDELFQSTTRASEQAQLSHVKQELKDKRQSIKTLQQAHRDRVSSLLGKDWENVVLDERYKDILDRSANQLALTQREMDSITRDVEQVEFKQRTAKEKLRAAQKEVALSEKKVSSIVEGGVSNYDICLKNAEEAFEEAQQQVAGTGSLVEYYRTALQTLEDGICCRLCQRAFKGKNDRSYLTFKQKLENALAKDAAEQLEEMRQEKSEDLEALKSVRSTFETWQRLTSSDIPQLEQELNKLDSEYNALTARSEKAEIKLDEVRTAHKSVEALSSVVSSLTKLEQDIKSLSSRAEYLAEQQSQSGPIRSIDEIRDAIEEVNSKISDQEKSRVRIVEEQDTAKSGIRDRELELSKLETDLGALSRRLDQKIALLARIEEYKSQNQKHKDTITKVDLDLEQLVPEIDAANAQYEDVAQRAEADLAELSQHAADLVDTVNGLDNLSYEIDAYINRGSEQKLARVIEQIGGLRRDIKQSETQKLQLTREISKLDEQLRDSERTRRHYSDNLRYRKDVNHLDALRAEIDQLQTQDSQEDRSQLKDKYEKRDRQAQVMAAKMEGILGAAKSKHVMLDQLEAEYKSDLKDAAARYREANVRETTTKAAIDDIGKYSKALDQAVTKYHSLKMEQVNAITEELWQQTYKGTDVDKIYIKSDFELKGATGTRSHNYRVVMVKRGIELDMRGRCSAGQKVLACIIIRLALAECFSKNCGVIALDEPTTNLDSKNIAALAHSLHELIKNRQQQGNFQIIIITHDEAFLRQMRCDEFVDDYYRVSRNLNDNSIILKQSIGEVMGNRD